MKDIKFSPFFQKTHPCAGQPTNFIEKIWRQLLDSNKESRIIPSYKALQFMYLNEYDRELWDASKVESVFAKSHTIRKGHRFKVGEWFAPKVWTGKPYRSKTYQFAPAIEIKKVFDFEIKDGEFFINGIHFTIPEIETIAQNDGLSLIDFTCWFQYPKEFEGQIICWNSEINY